MTKSPTVADPGPLMLGVPIYRQQPSTTDNNRQQPTTNRQQPSTTDNKLTTTDNKFFKRYFQIKRDFYASLPLKRLYKG